MMIIRVCKKPRTWLVCGEYLYVVLGCFLYPVKTNRKCRHHRIVLVVCFFETSCHFAQWPMIFYGVVVRFVATSPQKDTYYSANPTPLQALFDFVSLALIYIGVSMIPTRCPWKQDGKQDVEPNLSSKNCCLAS